MGRLFGLSRLGSVWHVNRTKIVNIAVLLLFVIYGYSMCVAPWVAGDFSWPYLQSVWDRWQGFNVGVLAFMTSVMAFKVAKYNSESQRRRNFQAAKAFLPHALDRLCDYLNLSVVILKRAWESKSESRSDEITPNLPEDYKEVFRDCIRYADPIIGHYLTVFLGRLQIQSARLKGYADQINDPSCLNPLNINIIEGLIEIGELQVFIDRLFIFARGASNFDCSDLSPNEIFNSYRQLNIAMENFVSKRTSLDAETKKRLDRGWSLSDY